VSVYDEEDLLPISALQHFAFCERQCALIHLEGLWEDNQLTAEGRQLHDTCHEAPSEARGDLRLARGLRLRSLALGVAGQADVVEFHRCSLSDVPPGIALPGVEGHWRPYPVEYKRGSPKPDACDHVQLCAQALCLEEMLGTEVPTGAMFYGRPRRRQEVPLTPELRHQTAALALRLHDFLAAARTPPARYEPKCRRCSLLSLCLPKILGPRRSAARYLEDALAEAQGGETD